MKRRALFVGVNEYEDPVIQNLRFAVGDAALLFAQFKAIGFEAELMPNPARGEVERKVAGMTKDMCGEGDVFLFYFAGHGFVAPGDDERLFCKDDFHAKLQYHSAGLSFAMLRDTTRIGGLNRIFIMDACRSNVFAGRRGGECPRDLVPMSTMMGTPPAGTAPSGGHAIWRSCCPGQFALELEPFEHGVFSLAIDRVMTECRENGRELAFDKPFMRLVVDKMRELAHDSEQMPEDQYSGNWPSLVLFNARKQNEAPPAPVPGVCAPGAATAPGAPAAEVLPAAPKPDACPVAGGAADGRRREEELRAAIETERAAAARARREAVSAEHAAAMKAMAERKACDEARHRARKEADLQAKLAFARKVREEEERMARIRKDGV